jgi:hypothetical protein
MGAKKAKQANLFQVDLDHVWSQYLEGSDWDKVTADEELAALQEARSKIESQVDELQSQHSLLCEQIDGLPTREQRARKHLEEAAKQMGVFGTEEVLLTSLRGAFPPSLFDRVMGTVGGGAAPVKAPCSPPALPSLVKPRPEALADRAPAVAETRSPLELVVLEVLDHEGMTAGQILKLVRRDERMSPETTSSELAKVTKRLAKQKVILVDGERRTKTYRLAGES